MWFLRKRFLKFQPIRNYNWPSSHVWFPNEMKIKNIVEDNASKISVIFGSIYSSNFWEKYWIELWKAKGCRRQCTHNWHRVKTIPHMDISFLAHVRWKQTHDHINHYTGIGRPNVKLCTIYLLLYQTFLSQINKFDDYPTNNNSYICIQFDLKFV